MGSNVEQPLGGWLRSVRGLTVSEVGVYVNTLALLAEEGGSLAADIPRIALAIGATRGQVSAAFDRLIAAGLIIMHEGSIRAPAIDAAFRKVGDRVERAVKGARARWAKNDVKSIDDGCLSNAQALVKHDVSMPVPPPSAPKRTRMKAEKDGTEKRGSRLPKDWVLTLRLANIALEIGLTEAEVRVEAAKFHDYWISKPGQAGVKLDWDATWRNWARTALERRQPRGSFRLAQIAPAPISIAANDDEWGKRVNVWRRCGGGEKGWHPSWGPMPGDKGCLVPADLLQHEAALF